MNIRSSLVTLTLLSTVTCSIDTTDCMHNGTIDTIPHVDIKKNSIKRKKKNNFLQNIISQPSEEAEACGSKDKLRHRRNSVAAGIVTGGIIGAIPGSPAMLLLSMAIGAVVGKIIPYKEPKKEQVTTCIRRKSTGSLKEML